MLTAKTLPVSTTIALLAALAAACSAAPDGAKDEEPAVQSSEALCVNGESTCGPCLADSSSPTGGSQTCVTCGIKSKRECTPPPPVPTPKSVSVWIDSHWNVYGGIDANATVSADLPAGCIAQGTLWWKHAATGASDLVTRLDAQPPSTEVPSTSFQTTFVALGDSFTAYVNCRGYTPAVSNTWVIH